VTFRLVIVAQGSDVELLMVSCADANPRILWTWKPAETWDEAFEENHTGIIYTHK
jgi:hypothetical protein